MQVLQQAWSSLRALQQPLGTAAAYRHGQYDVAEGRQIFFNVLYFCPEMSYKMEKCPILKDVLYFSKSSVRVLLITKL